MPSLLYIDTLRIVSQGTIHDSRRLANEDVDFFLLGSFDAMKIFTHKYGKPNEKIDSLSDLVELNRCRHMDVHTLYDRQPLYLYSEEDDSPVLKSEGGCADLPLVMALVQIQDEAIDQDSPMALIEAFKRRICTLLSDLGVKESNIQFEVFYDLGEADVVIIFRSRDIRNIGRVLFRLRGWEVMSDEDHRGIRILSICSHCAFPKQENNDIYYQKLNTWMTEEQKNSSQFVTFIDTSYGMDTKDKDSQEHFAFDQYMIGAFDFPEINSRDTSAFAKRCKYIISQLRDGNDHCFPFRTALSIPIVQLTGEDIQAYPSDRIIKTIRPDYALLDEYDPKKSKHFEELAMYIRKLSKSHNIWGNNESALQLERDVESLNVTLIGLLKHLIRLKEGRFEGDLYAFVAPVFEQLPNIAASYHNLITRLAGIYQTVKNDQMKAQDILNRNENDQEETQSLTNRIKNDQEEMQDISDRIYALYHEYVTDASRLITGLQHLLSVLSVSPHNYMETYGSNMRSISATCKLLVAYQGVTHGVAKAFDMKLQNPQHPGNDVETNEVLLVLPYRRTKQSTRTLFEHSSPEQRIATIRLDYSSMLDIDQTLIVLLHEVGHHIMTFQFRKDRQQPLHNAVFAYLLQEGLGDIYRNPVKAICEPINTQEKIHTIKWVWEEDDEKDLYKKSIQDEIKKVAQSIVTKLAEIFIKLESVYIKTVRDKEEPFALWNWFSIIHGQALNKSIEERLKAAHQEGQQNGFKPDDGCFVASIEKLLLEVVYESFYQFASVQRERKMQKEDNDLWRLDELCSYYEEIERYRRKLKLNRYLQDWEQYRKAEKNCKEHSDWSQPRKPEESMPGMLKRNIKNVLEYIEINHKLCVEEITFMFSDIYSDAFAIYMLRLDEQAADKDVLADQYLKIIKDTAAFEANKYFDKYHVLLRIYIVLTRFYGLEEEIALEKMSHALSAGTGVSSESISKNMRFIRDSLYYEYVSKFADICKNSLVDKRQSSLEMDKITKKLNEFYNGARIRITNDREPDVRERLRKKKTKAVAEGIHYFWKLSTTRG